MRQETKKYDEQKLMTDETLAVKEAVDETSGEPRDGKLIGHSLER